MMLLLFMVYGVYRRSILMWLFFAMVLPKEISNPQISFLPASFTPPHPTPPSSRRPVRSTQWPQQLLSPPNGTVGQSIVVLS
jgi:hypothetical protein